MLAVAKVSDELSCFRVRAKTFRLFLKNPGQQLLAIISLFAPFQTRENSLKLTLHLHTELYLFFSETLTNLP